MDTKLKDMTRQRDDLNAERTALVEESGALKKEIVELKVLTDELQLSQAEVLKKAQVEAQGEIIKKRKFFEAEVAAAKVDAEKVKEKVNKKLQEELAKKDQIIDKKDAK